MGQRSRHIESIRGNLDQEAEVVGGAPLVLRAGADFRFSLTLGDSEPLTRAAVLSLERILDRSCRVIIESAGEPGFPLSNKLRQNDVFDFPRPIRADR